MVQDKDIPTINLTVPTGWEQLDEQQLRYVFGLLAQGLPSPQVKTYCLFRWTGMQVMHKYGRGWWCKFADGEFRKRNSGGTSANSNKFGLRSACTEFVIMSEQVNTAIAALDWIDSLPSKPVRISRIGKHRALTADFQEVPFETFIICDNLYQGYLSAKDDQLLDDLARVLYQSAKVTPTEAERIGVFYWFASLKEMFARQFKHFFQPLAAQDDGNMFNQGQSQFDIFYRAVNAQIRALTKGDVTKEKDVLAIDTWRALEELNALAREYEEFSRKYPRTV